MLSIIIPTYNESETIGNTLCNLIKIISPDDEIIVVDGSSTDDTAGDVEQFPEVRLIECQRGRARQMNAGAAAAKGRFLLFLHADVMTDSRCLDELNSKMSDQSVLWGWFTFRLNSPRFVYRIIEAVSNCGNRATGIALGDHGIFVRRELFRKIGGFSDISLMEDIELSARLKSLSSGVEIKSPIKISVRRFENEGIFYTLIKMCVLRILYYLGVNPDTLSKFYSVSR